MLQKIKRNINGSLLRKGFMYKTKKTQDVNANVISLPAAYLIKKFFKQVIEIYFFEEEQKFTD